MVAVAVVVALLVAMVDADSVAAVVVPGLNVDGPVVSPEILQPSVVPNGTVVSP